MESNLKPITLKRLRRFCLNQNCSYGVVGDTVKIFRALDLGGDFLYAEYRVTIDYLNELASEDKKESFDVFVEDCIDRISKAILDLGNKRNRREDNKLVIGYLNNYDV